MFQLEFVLKIYKYLWGASILSHQVYSILSRNFQSFCVRLFNLGSCDLRLKLGRPPLCSLILVCLSQHRWLNAIRQEKAPSHSLAITIEIPKSVQYFQNMSHGQNLSSTAGEPEFFAQYFFEIPAPCFNLCLCLVTRNADWWVKKNEPWCKDDQ